MRVRSTTSLYVSLQSAPVLRALPGQALQPNSGAINNSGVNSVQASAMPCDHLTGLAQQMYLTQLYSIY